MTAKPIIERAPVATGRLSRGRGASLSTRVRRPQVRFLRRIARCLKALRAINRVGVNPNLALKPDDLVKAWTVSYFLPMLKSKDVQRQDRVALCEPKDEETLSKDKNIRRVARPKKGLRLPRLFAPCKQFELSC